MMNRNWKWAAVVAFAAVMTVGEAFAIQAAVKDAHRWLASDQVRGLETAGRAVAAAVTGAATRDCGRGECVIVRTRAGNREAARMALREARARLQELRNAREAAAASERAIEEGI